MVTTEKWSLQCTLLSDWIVAKIDMITGRQCKCWEPYRTTLCKGMTGGINGMAYKVLKCP